MADDPHGVCDVPGCSASPADIGPPQATTGDDARHPGGSDVTERGAASIGQATAAGRFGAHRSVVGDQSGDMAAQARTIWPLPRTPGGASTRAEQGTPRR